MKLVYRVGRDRLFFNNYHLHAAAKAHPALTLECSSELYRHLRALEGTTLIRVGARNESVAGAAAAVRGKSVYVLKARAAELEEAPPELDDIEKVLCALWVAVATFGGAEVPTNAVTAVLKSVEELAPESRRTTHSLLMSLHDRTPPLIERIKVPGQRSLHWLPNGSPPEDDRFDGWVGLFKALNPKLTTVVASGHATLGGMVQELVEIAIARSHSSTWPVGHPVTARDLDTAAGADDRAAEVTRFLRRRGATPGTVLGDLTKETIAGSPRVDRRVVKIQGPLGTGTYYDCPHIPGFERRALFVQYQALRYTLTSRRLRLLQEEHERASLLENHPEAVFRACGAVRIVGVHREVDDYASAIGALEANSALLSKKIRKSLIEYRRRLDDFLRPLGSKEDSVERARSLLGLLGFTLEDILDAPRPLIVAEDYATWFPEHMLRGLKPTEFLTRANTLSRYPNPHHTFRSDSDPRKAAVTCVDRPEALLYAASFIQTPILELLQTGARLLGRFFRHPGLLKVALDSPRAEVWRAALGGLVLLGDPAAEDAAWEELDQPRCPDSLVDALYALLALQRLDLFRIPLPVRQCTDRYVQSVLRQIIRAARQGLCLPQNH
jgi:hypothetical protein